jgi:uncharacterized protein (TIGR02646 family)
VDAALDAFTWGKCAYCEQIAAEDIEHFYPKSDYPNRMFRWDNMLRACKNCNQAKRDRFPCERGCPLLLDPCEDEPLDYFAWDFTTGAMGASPEPNRKMRARTTERMFALNHEPLREARRRKVHNVVFLLATVVHEEPPSNVARTRLKDELSAECPWLGIVRELLHRPGKYRRLLEAAIGKVPEIVEWTAEWL